LAQDQKMPVVGRYNVRHITSIGDGDSALVAQHTVGHFEILPNEVYDMILSELSANDLLNTYLVSTRFRETTFETLVRRSNMKYYVKNEDEETREERGFTLVLNSDSGIVIRVILELLINPTININKILCTDFEDDLNNLDDKYTIYLNDTEASYIQPSRKGKHFLDNGEFEIVDIDYLMDITLEIIITKRGPQIYTLTLNELYPTNNTMNLIGEYINVLIIRFSDDYEPIPTLDNPRFDADEVSKWENFINVTKITCTHVKFTAQLNDVLNVAWMSFTKLIELDITSFGSLDRFPGNEKTYTLTAMILCDCTNLVTINVPLDEFPMRLVTTNLVKRGNKNIREYNIGRVLPSLADGQLETNEYIDTLMGNPFRLLSLIHLTFLTDDHLERIGGKSITHIYMDDTSGYTSIGLVNLFNSCEKLEYIGMDGINVVNDEVLDAIAPLQPNKAHHIKALYLNQTTGGYTSLGLVHCLSKCDRMIYFGGSDIEELLTGDVLSSITPHLEELDISKSSGFTQTELMEFFNRCDNLRIVEIKHLLLEGDVLLSLGSKTITDIHLDDTTSYSDADLAEFFSICGNLENVFLNGISIDVFDYRDPDSLAHETLLRTNPNLTLIQVRGEDEDEI
jgi:hypothetical protein